MNGNYGPIPFWSWNDELETEKLTKQVDWMKQVGMGGFIMHARSGLKTEYLSKEWMECVKTCADRAKDKQMKAWIYDENGWPSGFVGGRLLEKEENRDRYILFQIGDFDEKATVTYLLHDDTIERVKKKDREGSYLNLYIHVSTSTADILNPEVVKQFLQLTHEQYSAYFGAEFSDKIEGFFTDEPQYQRWYTPYTKQIADYFQTEYGEDILERLGLLFVEKEGYREFRYRYWKGMQKLMLESFAKQVYTWCDEHGVKLTGHYVEEVTLGFQMMACGGIMPFYEYEHIPGIDWLAKASDCELAPRQVGSVAAQLGKKRVLTETFGCCGWDVTPAEMKRILSFQYVNGVNMMCHHLLPYSERGVRKYDYPAHYSDLNPWVSKEFRSFNEYYTNMGCLLGEGEQHVNVAVLHPIRSAYFVFQRELEEEGFGTKVLDDSLKQTCRSLSSRGINYHFLDETLMEKYGFARGNQIGCGRCQYDYLVLPTIYTMDQSTEKLLHQYVKQGGKVLLLGEKPTYVEATEHDFDYLQTNCTIEDIENAQPFRVKNYETEVYTTYRTLGEETYLYAINASAEHSYVQSYDCGEQVRSFRKVDLLDGTEHYIPLTLELGPGEDALLYFSEEQPDQGTTLTTYDFHLNQAEASFVENYLPVDYVSYSVDGKTYSKPWPHMALFYKLIKEKYQGPIYFKYEYEVREIPSEIKLRIEENGQRAVLVNGVVLTEKQQGDESYLTEYDITDIVKRGVNVCVVEMDWYEDDIVHYALFGENVTESLKNCLAYDSELQPIELVGKFGVFPKEGYKESKDERYISSDSFYIGDMPKIVNTVIEDGLPFFAGELHISQTIYLQDSRVKLSVPGKYQMATVTVNHKKAGKLFFGKELDISNVAVVGENLVEIQFIISNRNRLGPHHTTRDEDEGVGPWNFGVSSDWEEDQNKLYRPTYDLKRFYS